MRILSTVASLFYKKFCVIEAFKDSTDTIVNDTSIQ